MGVAEYAQDLLCPALKGNIGLFTDDTTDTCLFSSEFLSQALFILSVIIGSVPRRAKNRAAAKNCRSCRCVGDSGPAAERIASAQAMARRSASGIKRGLKLPLATSLTDTEWSLQLWSNFPR